MVVYLSVFFLLSILSCFEYASKISYKNKKILICIILMVYILYSTLYNGPFGDYSVYESAFVNMDISHFPKRAEVYWEYLYVLLSYFVRLFTSNYKVFRLVLAIIVMSFWYKIYTDPTLTLGNKYNFLVMLAVWALDSGQTHIARSTVAIAICLYSFRFITKRRFFKFCICVIFAMGFHSMSVTWFPLYFILNCKKRKNIKNLLLVLLVLTVLLANQMSSILLFFSRVFSYVPIIGEKISTKLYNYTNRGTDAMYGITYSYEFMLLKAVLNMILCIAVAQYMYVVIRRKSGLFSNIVSIKNRNGTLTARNIFESLYMQYLIGAVLYIMALEVSIALSRAALYYIMAQYWLFSYFFEYYKKSKYSIFLLLLYFIYLFLRMIINVL